MKTLYAACLSRLGLSLADAAGLHEVRIDTVKSWSAGRNPVPAGAWTDLRACEARIVDSSEAAREAWDDNGDLRIVLGPPEIAATVTDHVGLMGLADFFLTADDIPPIALALKA